jgi:3-oxoacyl-[acyl-carrier-protein] synthase III
MPEVAAEVLRELDQWADLDLVVMHQANLRINRTARKALGLPEEKVHNNSGADTGVRGSRNATLGGRCGTEATGPRS